MVYSEKEIHSLIERFVAQKLPKAEWTHEAHLAVAIWFCRRHPAGETLQLVRGYIVAHNESVGTPNTDSEGYHETITRFWLWAAREFLDRNDYETDAPALDAFIDQGFGSRDLPLRYYTRDVLFSVEARRGSVEPDLQEMSEL